MPAHPRSTPTRRRLWWRRLRLGAHGVGRLDPGHPHATARVADAHFGLANRLAAPLARRVFLSFPVHGRSGAKYRVTGRPIPPSSRAGSRAESRRTFGLPAEGPVLLVAGGSQGARSLNELAVRAFAEEGPAVLHLSGVRDYEHLLPRITRYDYRLLPYTDEYGLALGAADLALARAGGTVFELAAAGLPAILVPYPHATGDHQTRNAEYFAAAGGALVVSDAELERVPALVDDLLADGDRRRRMSEAMRRVARPDAAAEIAEELIELASARR